MAVDKKTHGKDCIDIKIHVNRDRGNSRDINVLDTHLGEVVQCTNNWNRAMHAGTF
jgi:hypothetical protein